MENEKREFYVKVNGQILFELEIGGDKSSVEAFDKKVIQTTYGIFGDWSDLGKCFLREIELTVTRVFRDKQGHFVNPKNIIQTEPKNI